MSDDIIKTYLDAFVIKKNKILIFQKRINYIIIITQKNSFGWSCLEVQPELAARIS